MNTNEDARTELRKERDDEMGRCHTCGHWSATHCNGDGFAYCDEHYPEGLR